MLPVFFLLLFTIGSDATFIVIGSEARKGNTQIILDFWNLQKKIAFLCSDNHAVVTLSLLA